MSDPGRDRLSLLGMRFSGRHGALEGERDHPQRFEVDVILHGDLGEPATTDELESAADYRLIVEAARGVIEGEPMTLIEALAGAIAARVLGATRAPTVQAVEVRVRKPDAPLDAEVETVEASLFRRR